MLKNYLITSLRNLRRNKLFSFINIAGLSICIAVSVLLVIWIKDELSYDRFHEKSDQIFRLTTNFYTSGQYLEFATAAFPVGPAIKDLYPEILEYTRFRWTSDIFQYDEKIFSENNVFYVDDTVFEIFNFQFIRGDPGTVLSEPYSIVLTESTSRKYFGDNDPIGKTLIADSNLEFTVTGVLKDIPHNSHIKFDILISMSSFRPELYDRMSQNWGDPNYLVYLHIQEQADISFLENKLADFYDDQVFRGQETGYDISFELKPLNRIYLHSNRLAQAGPTGNLNTVIIFIAITFLIIILACVNYVLISTAFTTKRTKEISIRKVLGSDRNAIKKQFIIESILITTFSSLIAVSLAEISLPLFNTLANKDFTSIILQLNNYIFALPIFVILIGFAAGFYPAVYISRLLPIQILKMHSPIKFGKLSLRKILVVLQFIISSAIIISTIIIYQQLGYIKNKDLGFNTESLLVINFDWDSEVMDSFDVIKNEYLVNPEVVGVTASVGLLGEPTRVSGIPFQTKGGINKDLFLSIFGVDPDFKDVYDIKLTSGRWFSPERPADVREAIIVNETAAHQLGYDTPADIIGQQWGSDLSGEIIGVVKDIHFKPLHQPVEPMAFQLIGHHFTNFRHITIAYNTDDLSSTISGIESTWNEMVPHRPFTYFFYDDFLNDFYGDDHQFAQIFTVSSFLAIFIACIGLFGLVSFTVEQRKKEISIRKVLGSSISGIFMLLSKEYVLLVTISILIASPAAYYLMTKWLENFAYRTSIGIGIFLLAMAAILLIALLTVSYQSVRAAYTNPSETLKYE